MLFAFGVHSKELQGHELPKVFPPQPSWSSLWLGHAEAGDTEFFVSRGFVHVIGTPRGFLKSGDGGSREWDSYDVLEWIAKQPWCDGNIGMIGIGAFASEQFHLARQQPPWLKAIFAYDPRGAYGKWHDADVLRCPLLVRLRGLSRHNAGLVPISAFDAKRSCKW